ncbi:MAG: bifunctional 2-polyprenyl-6-hydroxyphenol methylase/3-demethylubiquinol 3-O-methyltransferase UbiG [Kistimonas sp.]|nr:bifunctional 2-polyprenyl-6-hydroxyphenol methylase/3-demethylubiquinol 3-O-methyltransferase UbiG [Kistimonas sp.]
MTHTQTDTQSTRAQASDADANIDKNVDEKEIARFSALARRWWDPHSEFRALHDINPLRLDYIDQRVGLCGKTLLDVGCGGGILSESAARRGASVTGIDMGEPALSVARLHGLESGVSVDYVQTTAEQMAEEKPAAFDVVACLEMLEHVPDPAAVVAACARLVKPGGHLFFSTINRNPKSWLFAIVGAEYVLRLLPRGTHEFRRFIRPHELARWCRESGLSVEQGTGLLYNPLTQVYRLQDDDLDVNYMLYVRSPGEDPGEEQPDSSSSSQTDAE